MSPSNKEIWLSLDLSSPRGTLALHQAEPEGRLVLLASEVLTETGAHSEKFIPHLESTLKACGLSIDQMSRFITSSGPGSFTGLRIALSSLKALAYVKKAPIEILSGSEARAFKWIKNQSQLSCNKIYVLTYITADRFVSAKFKKNSGNSFEWIEEKTYSDNSFLEGESSAVILVDSRINKTALPVDTSVKIYEQILNAEDLAEALLTASSRKTYQSISEWVNLTPNYFGSTRF
jgi:tRNA threonylcarbamoyladenosine biosynthesis protein TsaB